MRLNSNRSRPAKIRWLFVLLALGLLWAAPPGRGRAAEPAPEEGLQEESAVTPGEVILKLLGASRRVALGVAVKSIAGPAAGQAGGGLTEDAARSREAALMEEVAETLLMKYSTYPRFALIDPDATARALAPLKAQRSGYGRDIDVTKVGGAVKATHLLIVIAGRGKDTFKLVRVDDSALLAIGSRDAKK